MSNPDIIRAWKDEQYRNSLSKEQQAQLPENPAGELELSDAEMERVLGASSSPIYTAGCCYWTARASSCQIGWCALSLVACITPISQFFC